MDLELRVSAFSFRFDKFEGSVQGLAFMVQGAGFKVSGSGLRVWESPSMSFSFR